MNELNLLKMEIKVYHLETGHSVTTSRIWTDFFFKLSKYFVKGGIWLTFCWFSVVISCTAVLLETKSNAAGSLYFP